MQRRSIARAVAAALAALLVHGGARADADPRELFAQGDLGAAGAAFEARWRASGDVTDGLNGVVAFRSKGEYAYARGLLERVMRTRTTPALSSRARALASSLANLTAEVVVDDDVQQVMRNGVSAVRVGKLFVVEPGKSDLVLHRDGCVDATWQGVLLPGQRVEVPAKLDCAQEPGRLRVALDVGSVRIAVDGATQDSGEEFEKPISAGEHDVRITRKHVVLYDAAVPIETRKEHRVTIDAPMKAHEVTFVLGLATQTFSTLGGTTFGAGIHAGIDNAYVWLVDAGGGASSVGEIASSLWLGLSAGTRWPYVRWNTVSQGGLYFGVEAAPLVGRLDYIAGSRDASRLRGRLVAFEGLPVTVWLASKPFMAELAIWPLGISMYSEFDPNSVISDRDRNGYTFGGSLRFAAGYGM